MENKTQIGWRIACRDRCVKIHRAITTSSFAGYLAVFAIASNHVFFLVRDAKVVRIIRQRRKTSGKNFIKRPSHDYVNQRETTSDDEQPNPEDEKWQAFSMLPQSATLHRFLRIYHKFSFFFNSYLIAKNTIISLLGLSIFHEYRYLDCYILGRLMFNGRVVDMANHFVIFIGLFQIIWFFIAHLTENPIKFPIVEFLLYDRKAVLSWENRNQHFGPVQEELDKFFDQIKQPETDFCRCNEPNSNYIYYNTLLDYPFSASLRGSRSSGLGSELKPHGIRPSPDTEESNNADLHKPRPNRTTKSWCYLSMLCIVSSFVACGFFIFICAVFWCMVVPLLVGQRGFELTHINCVRWILDQQRSTSETNRTVGLWVDHRLIFDVGDINSYVEPKRFSSPFESVDGNYVTLNYYHVARIVVNLIENIYIFTEINLCLLPKALILILMSCDIIDYCQSINRRLVQMLAYQRCLAQMDQDSSNLLQDPRGSNNVDHEPIRSIKMRNLKSRIMMDTLDAQAMAADLFSLIDSYSKFASVQLSYLLAFWLSYSALVSGWIFIPTSDLPKGEWYLVHCFATIFLFIIISPLSKARSSTLILHNLISSAMALDENKHSKRTWMTLLRFFSPVPLNCFTILRVVEMSPLFALKLLTWLASALIVVSSFFR